MENVIELPEDATDADFAAHVNDNEVFTTTKGTTNSGAEYVNCVGDASRAAVIGKMAVRFARVTRVDDPTKRRSSQKQIHTGWRKETVGTIKSVGETYFSRTLNRETFNCYV